MQEIINKHMNGVGCPTEGCIGECALIEQISVNNNGMPVWMAYLYIWDDHFHDSAQVAKWFIDAGAEMVSVGWVMYDSENGDRDGRTEEGTRSWHVTYSM